MLRKNQLFTITIIALVVLFTAIDNGLAQGRHRGESRGGHGRGHQRAPFWSDLTDAQKEELQEMIETNREAVHAKLEEWGVELPDHPQMFDRLGGQLTEEQQAEMKIMIQTMKDDGASRKEIRDAIHGKLEEWAIELPMRGEYHRFRGLGDQLTDAQRDELHALAQHMKEDRASRKEIRDAVHAKLNEWGVKCPEGHGPRRNRGNP